jgi:hypothetical protein
MPPTRITVRRLAGPADLALPLDLAQELAATATPVRDEPGALGERAGRAPETAPATGPVRKSRKARRRAATGRR